MTDSQCSISACMCGVSAAHRHMSCNACCNWLVCGSAAAAAQSQPYLYEPARGSQAQRSTSSESGPKGRSVYDRCRSCLSGPTSRLLLHERIAVLYANMPCYHAYEPTAFPWAPLTLSTPPRLPLLATLEPVCRRFRAPFEQQILRSSVHEATS